MTGINQRQVQFVAPMERYCQLGGLLPAASDFDTDDVAELAQVKTVLAEMENTKTEMDALLEWPA